MDIEAVLTEVANALADTGIGVFANPPSAAEYPAIVVKQPTLITYAETLGGRCQIDVPVTLFVQNTDLASSFELIYRLLSYNAEHTSIPDALLSHAPTTYKQLKVSTATSFQALSETGISVDVNLTIYS